MNTTTNRIRVRIFADRAGNVAIATRASTIDSVDGSSMWDLSATAGDLPDKFRGNTLQLIDFMGDRIYKYRGGVTHTLDAR
jgi:hypothetical protein